MSSNVSSPSFQGNDFSNNLLSDLAPILTLFGEQVTKQYLSLSLGWSDNIIIAVAPLGILTVVVSAIRVSQYRWLKGLTGRARENRAIAEVEVLSSTSPSVCELYDGQQIVRIPGVANTKEFIYRKWQRGKDSSKGVYGLAEAVDNGVLHFVKRTKTQHLFREQYSRLNKLLESSPNIILNLPYAASSSRELWTFAVIGCTLQSIVLTLAALTTYHWEYNGGSKNLSQYGYPCFLTGTLVLFFGLMLCSYVIEASTTEDNLAISHAPEDSDYQIMRIQLSCVASEQRFSSFAIFNDDKDKTLRTSRLNNQDHSFLAATGALISICGFVCQFIGIRGLNWVVTILQLGAVLVMTGIRSYVRRGLAHQARCIPLPAGQELEWMSEYICNVHRFEVITGCYATHSQWERIMKANSGPTKEMWYTNGDTVVQVPSFGFLEREQIKSSRRYELCTDSPVEALIHTHIQLKETAGYEVQSSDMVGILAESIIRLLRFQKKSDILPRFSSGVFLDIPVFYTYIDHEPVQILYSTLPSPWASTLKQFRANLKQRMSALTTSWIFSLSRRLNSDEKQDSEDKETASNDSLGKYALLRIVGSETGHGQGTYEQIENLQGWLGREDVYRVSRADGYSGLDVAFSVQGMPIMLGYVVSVDFVLGMSYSCLLQEPPVPKPPIKLESLKIPYPWQHSSQYAKCSEPTRVNDLTTEPTELRRQLLPDLAVITEKASLERHCAMELFSVWMKGWASTLNDIGGKTSLERLPWQGTHGLGKNGLPSGQRWQWKNSNVDRLCEILVSTGLATSVREAYSVIVPALHTCNLLPRKVSPPGGGQRTLDSWLLKQEDLS